MSSMQNGPAPGRRGWWQSIVQWLRRGFGAGGGADHSGWRPAGGNEFVTIDGEEDDWTFTTPAQGDAHDFTVHVHCSWSASRTAPHQGARAETERQLREVLDRLRSGIRRRVEDEVRPRAREFPPYRAAEAEREIGAEVATCMSDGDVRCLVTLRVDVADAVRQELCAFWSRRMDLDLALDHSRHKAERIREVQDAWTVVLAGGLTDLEAVFGGKPALDGSSPADAQPWMAPSALLLAEQPTDVAQVLSTMLDGRVQQGRTLLADLAVAVRQHQRVDAYDVAVQSDVALRRIMQGLGVPVPQPLADDGEQL